MRWNDLHHPHTEALAIRTFIKYHNSSPIKFSERIEQDEAERYKRIWLRKFYAKFYSGNIFLYKRTTEQWIQKILGSYRKTRVPCSCYACRNPRRNTWAKKKDRIPIKERRQLQAMEYQLEEYEKEK